MSIEFFVQGKEMGKKKKKKTECGMLIITGRFEEDRGGFQKSLASLQAEMTGREF